MHPPSLLSAATAAGLSWVVSAKPEERRSHARLDLAFGLAIASWGVLMCLAWHGRSAAWLPVWAIAASLQLTLLSAEWFFLLAAGRWQRWDRRWLAAHCAAVVGWAVFAVGDAFHSARPALANTALVWLNIGFVASLIWTLVSHAWQLGHGRAWAVALVALPVCVILVNDMTRPAAVSASLLALQPLVGVQLALLWVLIRRGEHLSTLRDSEAAAAHTRLAQDLHDGVGYHLTSLIAALEGGTGQQRATAGELQHCLLELKLLVDGTVAHQSVLGHLANLRYRSQPLLDAAGIALHWEVDESDQLESLHGDTAVQVLRVAQEALANVIRHSGARNVWLRCETANGSAELVLEVRDDGQGLPSCHRARQLAASGAPGGHGLRSMRGRAERLGGRLRIDSSPGRGTRVQLRVPIHTAQRAQPS